MQKSGFFNSNNGDRVYSADDFAAYFGDLVSKGIFVKNADSLKVTAATGMNVTVQPGTGWINGYHYSNTTPLDLPITTADGVNPRIDRIVLRWDNMARSISLAVKDGTPAPTPSPPNLTRNSDTWELGIGTVYVVRGALAINAENISDTRFSPVTCDIVNSLVMAVYQ